MLEFMKLTHPIATHTVDCRGPDIAGKILPEEMLHRDHSQPMYICIRETWWTRIAHEHDYKVSPMNGLFGGHVPLLDTPNDALEQLLKMEGDDPKHDEKVMIIQVMPRLRALLNMVMEEGGIYRDGRTNPFPKWKACCTIDLKDFDYFVHTTCTRKSFNSAKTE